MLYKFHGMTHFTISKSSGGLKCLVSRKIDVVMQIVIMLFITLWNIYCWILRIDFNDVDLLVTLFFHTITAFTVLAILILFITGLVNENRLPIIFYQINKFDMRLYCALKVKLVYKKYSKKIILIRLLSCLFLVVIDGLALVNVQKYGSLSATELLVYYYFSSLLSVSSILYCCLILECRMRIQFVNHYTENLFFGSRFVACIETKLTPIVNVWYRLEDIKTELNALIDTIENINRHFEMLLFVKIAHTFVSILWCAYYLIENSGEQFNLLLSLNSEFHILVWAVGCLLDLCIDIHVYKCLLSEVRLLFLVKYWCKIFCLRLIFRKN